MKKATFKIGGSNVIMQTIIPNPPTADFIMFKPLKIEDIASPKELPIIGIKFPDKNFAVLMLIESAFEAKLLCIVKIPTKIVTNKDSVKITTFLTADVKPEMLKLSLMLPQIERAKKEPVIGSSKSFVIKEITWDIIKSVEL